MFSVIYVAALCAANFSVFYFGPSFTPVNAFLFIGFDLALRDKIHERFGIKKIFFLVFCSSAISFAINPASLHIAVASVSAFIAASTFDTLVYQRLIKKEWMLKANASNIVGAAIDSAVFPLIAFGAFLPWIVAGQFVAKVFGGLLWSWLLRKR